MVKKGTRSGFLHTCPPWSTPTAEADSPHTFSATLMEENVAGAEDIITKWDPQGSSYAKVTSLFHEDRDEARRFLGAVDDLRHAMHFFVADSHSQASRSALLARTQILMQAAMRRLQKEFHQILLASRDRLDEESVSATERSTMSLTSFTSSFSDLEEEEEEEIHSATKSESIGEVERVSALSMADLRSIAECMMSSGYGKECIKIYKLVRRSIVDEGLYKLGFERPSQTQIQKLEWDVLDIRIRSWLAASRVAARTLFSGERVLCDEVFASSDLIRESCFAEIAMEPATQFFGFPGLVAAKTKRSPEKMFRMLDMYDSISELWPEIEFVFSYQSTSPVRFQANASLVKLGEAVRSLFTDLELAIQRDNSKAAVPGGGLHPLSRYVMNYAAFLADYSSALEDIFADYPLQTPSPLMESFYTSTPAPSSLSSMDGDNPLSPVSVRIAWLILVLLCKLDSKAELYREKALAYLFLTNNLLYVVKKVQGCKLSELLGDDWVERHEAKAKAYAASYERLAWSNVLAAIPGNLVAVEEMDAQAAKERMRRFNEAFEAAHRAQARWAVVERRTRVELKLSIAGKVVPAYRPFYERCRLLLQGERDSPSVVRFTPEDVANYLSDLFSGGAGTGWSVSSVSGSSASGSSKALPRSK